MTLFYILDGNNGATYILNAKDSTTVGDSLKFYKARTPKQKVMKNALKLYLHALGTVGDFFRFKGLKNKETIEAYLADVTQEKIDFALDENSSVLISPTRDKVIVHHHRDYFHKFAFGNSYAKVKNEANVYALLDRSLQHFKVSKFYDLEEKEDEHCSFKLSSEDKSEKKEIDLTLALVEMFNVSKQEKYLLSVYVAELKNKYEQSNISSEIIDSMLNTLEHNHEESSISLGLVHRDFKPWNINTESGLLIYDFEEAVTDGPPLEDLLNYHIDPIVRYLSASEIEKIIFEERHLEEYTRYLEKLEIDLDFKVLLYCYLTARVVFWMQVGEQETAVKYVTLFEYIVREYKEK